MAVRVEDRTAGVAAGGMVGRQEADRLRLVTAFRIDIPQRLGNVIVEDFRIVLLDDTLQRRNRTVVDGIGRSITFDMTVGDAERHVGIRVESLVRLEFHLGLHVVAHCQLDLVAGPVDGRAQIVVIPLVEGVVQQIGRVVIHLRLVGLGQGQATLLGCEHGILEQVIAPGLGVAAVLGHLLLEIRRLDVVREFLVESLHEGREDFLVDGLVIILEETLHVTVLGFLVGQLAPDARGEG